LFHPTPATKQFCPVTKPFPASAQTSGNGAWLSISQRNGGQRRQPNPETVKMQTLSFILAFAFVLAGPTIAGSSDSSLPGIGTFAYNGSSIAVSAPQTIIVAAR
jgi:hypothetical protein